MSCPCCACCFPKDDTTKHYPHIEYQSMTKLSTQGQPKVAAEMPEFQQVPLKKTFEFPQHRMEYGAKPDLDAEEVVTQQPVQEYPGHVPLSRRSMSQDAQSSEYPALRRFRSAPSGTCRMKPDNCSDTDPEHGGWMPDVPTLAETEPSTASDEETKAEPRLTFSLYYDLQRRILTATLFKGYDLPAKDRRGTSDPFVVMYLDPSREEIVQSRIKYETLNPSFNEHFEFKNVPPDDIRRQTMVFKVYDHDKYSKNDFIGASMLPLKDADLYGATMTITIDEKALDARSEKGELLLSLLYQPAVSQLQGVVLKATGLQKQDVVGLADPYVKVYLVRGGKRVVKWKTTVKKNTLVPVFNESFVFDIAMMDLSDVRLDILVMDYDRFTANDLVGVITIGESSPHESGRSHWNEMMASPKHRVSRWHSIREPQPGFQVETLKRS